MKLWIEESDCAGQGRREVARCGDHISSGVALTTFLDGNSEGKVGIWPFEPIRGGSSSSETNTYTNSMSAWASIYLAVT